MKRKYWCIIILSFIALLGYLGAQWFEHIENATAFPESGEYCNQELELTLSFSDSTIKYADSRTEKMNIHPAGRIMGQDSAFNAWYSWNQEKDELMLEFITYPGEELRDSVFIFLRKN